MPNDIEELIIAAGPKPRSGLLRLLLAAAKHRADLEAAAEYLESLVPGHQEDAVREMAARFLHDEGWLQEALAWAEGKDGALAILRASILVGLGREEEARAVYIGTLALFPKLRDDSLDARFAKAQATASTSADAGAGANVVQLAPRERRTPALVPVLVPEAEAPAERRVDFSAIGGLEDVKTQIRRRIVLPFERKGLFDRFRKRAGGGVLLYGPPGCGKTLLARATATECGAAFIPVEITDVLEKWIGDSEKRVKALFSQAREKRPAVLFFDEVEALAARRRFSENSVTSSMVSTFLNEMDGFKDNNDGVLVLAATNTPWAVDAAFRRPGRFDRSLFVPPPDRAAREAILGIELTDRPVERDLPVAEIAAKTSGFSGADMRNIVEEAVDLAIERSIGSDTIAPISAADLRAAARTVKPTTGEWLTQARNYAKFANEGGFYDDVVRFLDKHGR